MENERWQGRTKCIAERNGVARGFWIRECDKKGVNVFPMGK
jgi:hypothetical protein